MSRSPALIRANTLIIKSVAWKKREYLKLLTALRGSNKTKKQAAYSTIPTTLYYILFLVLLSYDSYFSWLYSLADSMERKG